ncbi:MAG: sigma-54 dependent transcriptional regulator [Desulfobacteraceae bacterium]|jgi:transcriptional regulator with PAS, ATPase and Fis domain|nr:sigma-54 dependent transcriptional regulator [Desulfobacteraceae bacterium]
MIFYKRPINIENQQAKIIMKTELIGVSANIKRIKELIEQIADTGLNTVVYGETGVGKELVVQSLYQKSNRVGKPYVKVNCAALPDTLLESEMFGYEQGAFTGAEHRRRGKFEQANGGLLFLDEIGDMSLPLQSKLLHVLQGGDYSPLGSERTVKMGAWVVAATNHDLEKDMAEKKFREDLYYRLSTIKIHIEPLRKRPEDIPLLIDHYIKLYTEEFAGKSLSIPTPKAVDQLIAYDWPGNTRELQNVLKRLMILDNIEHSMEELLNPLSAKKRVKGISVSAGQPPSPMDFLDFDINNLKESSSLSLKDIRKKAMEKVEKEIIAYVLEKTHWNRSKANKILGISYKTLLQKIQELELTPPS